MGMFKRDDPKGIVREHCRMIRLSLNYLHEIYPNDSILQGVISYSEVLDRKRKQHLVHGKTFPYKDILVDPKEWLEELH